MIDLDKPDPFNPDEGYPHDQDDQDSLVGWLLDTRGRTIATAPVRTDGRAVFNIPFDAHVGAIRVKQGDKDAFVYGLTAQEVPSGGTFEVTMTTELM